MLKETIDSKKKRVIDKLSQIDNNDERLRYLIALGRAMPEMDSTLKIDPFLVKGCISKAWLAPQVKEGRIFFHADSEAMIVKGIIAILLKVFNDSTPQEVLETDTHFLTELGITDHLSMNRRNGLSNILKMIKTYATACRQV